MASARAPTLRLRLTLVTVGALAVALTVGALLLVQLVTAQRVQALDEAVLARADTVRQLLVTDRIPDLLAVLTPGEVVQVLDSHGEVVATSANASVTLPVVPADVLVQAPQGARAEPAVVTVDSPYAGLARVALVEVPLPDLPEQWRTAADGAGLVIAAAVPLGEVQQTQRALTLLLAVVFPLLALALALVVWLVLGRALRPVEDLRAAADDVAATGGPGSLPVPRAGELAALAQTLNAMLDRLEASAAGERAAAQAARSAAQRQQAFVADAAHELRSPLASLSAAVEVAQRHPRSYPRPELLVDLEADVARLQALVEDLLLLARVGTRPRRIASVDLAALAGEVVGALAPTRVQVAVTGAGDGMGDPVALTRILRNLLTNAIRHAAVNVEVVVAGAVVTVTDDGAGIADSELDRVFERFVRLDEAREREAGGSGLGLAIARELARELGGEVRLERADPSGVRAVLTLPGTPADPS
ncbi:MAG: ATP-binding protein [Beutenbergiaceae bacterium]